MPICSPISNAMYDNMSNLLALLNIPKIFQLNMKSSMVVEIQIRLSCEINLQSRHLQLMKFLEIKYGLKNYNFQLWTMDNTFLTNESK